jgi:hypothetical protein
MQSSSAIAAASLIASTYASARVTLCPTLSLRVRSSREIARCNFASVFDIRFANSESGILFLDGTFTAVLTQSPTRDSQRHIGAESKAFGALGSDSVVA